MSLSDLRSLETTLAKDKGYSGESPVKEGLGGFVCPRANAYGGREGIIPPGVAAQRGLVPKGMHRIDVSATVQSAVKASRDGRTEADRYREYYSNQPAESLTREREQEERELPQLPAQQPAQEPAPEQARTPSPAPSRTRSRTPQRETACHPAAEQPGHPAKAEKAAKAAKRPQSPARMFSQPETGTGDDDTLDGFYDSLKGWAPGTDETAPDVEKRASGTVEGPVSAGDAGPDAATLAAVLTQEDPSGARQELQVLRQAIRRTEEALAYARETTAAVVRERDELLRESERLRRQIPPPGESVRLVLSQPEERLRIGGDHWDVKLVGALHASRTGATLVLTVTDVAYASELLSALQPGPVVLLSASRRSSCVYRGECAKIYGEPDSPDFIAAFRFDVRDSTPTTAPE